MNATTKALLPGSWRIVLVTVHVKQGVLEKEKYTMIMQISCRYMTWSQSNCSRSSIYCYHGWHVRSPHRFPMNLVPLNPIWYTHRVCCRSTESHLHSFCHEVQSRIPVKNKTLPNLVNQYRLVIVCFQWVDTNCDNNGGCMISFFIINTTKPRYNETSL